MRLPIAVLSFLPDAGHVLPLLRLAALFSARGHPVICHLPQECAGFVEGYDFSFSSLGPALSSKLQIAHDRVLRKLSGKSVFYNAFSVYSDLSACYLDPLVLEVSNHLDAIKASLANEHLLLILSDDHVFRPFYVKLSSELELPLVINTSEGYRIYQRKFVQFYGINDLPDSVQALVERLGAASEFAFRLLRRLHRATAEERLQSAAMLALRSSQCNGDRTTTVATGYNGFLERRYLRPLLTIPDDPPAFGPVCRIRPLPLAPAIQEWIERERDTVVYVSFGSMIGLEGKFAQAILDGLASLNLRTLWSMPRAQQERLLPDMHVPDRARFVDSVPPLEVLSHANVRCGINHAGAGSVQDCLACGTPMLCIPFMWDQPFNSSVVVRLGAGHRLWKRQVRPETIAQTVGSILADASMAGRAAELMDVLCDGGHENGVIDFILNQPPIRRRELSQC